MIPTCLMQGCFSGCINGGVYCAAHCTPEYIFNNNTHIPPKTLQEKTKEILAGINPPPPEDHPNRNGRRHTDRRPGESLMSERYPKYYKRIPEGITSLDIYAICALFPVTDDSGCINHARKKLLIPGTRTGGKSLYDDIKEARDTLNRWLELNKPPIELVPKTQVFEADSFKINGVEQVPKN